MSDISNKIILIFGPTASGKSEFAVNLAEKIGNAEIINADSMQIYKEIPIITNQPTKKEMGNIKHHLFSIKSITDHSDLNNWLALAKDKIDKLLSDNKTAILVGGTGMYLRILAEGISPIDEITAETKNFVQNKIDNTGWEELYHESLGLGLIDPKVIKMGDRQRFIRALEVYYQTGRTIKEWQKEEKIKFYDKDLFKIYFINKDRQKIYEKINKRFENMVENGVLEEAKNALKIFDDFSGNKDVLSKMPAYKAHGLREVIGYIEGDSSRDEAIKEAQKVTRNYAKRQFTWWRGWKKSLLQNGFDFEEVGKF